MEASRLLSSSIAEYIYFELITSTGDFQRGFTKVITSSLLFAATLVSTDTHFLAVPKQIDQAHGHASLSVLEVCAAFHP